ncbi:hypothetical protein [Streptomyces ureilyticus]|uniref:Uncharacterized protein n=1 Tax=Streptomyces ureilyticus TaxID=1775131 RepID=A0ABX0DJZ2_9ACTN|nr:hypothetical protein [Streptomyces ureilyticus]NGO40628.1 hypothetical protein [Streptomyces ureilyticus]
MNATGATPPYRAGLARITEATSRVGTAVRDKRSWAREKRDALSWFHDDLGLRPGASISDVLDAVRRLRGREVEPVPLSFLPPTVSGIAVLGKDDDYIGLSDRLSRRHTAHVILHEVRHLLPSRKGGGPTAAGSLTVHSHFDGVTLQSLKEQMAVLPDRVQKEILTGRAMLRAGYPNAEERTCEATARVVLPLLDLDATSKRTSSLIAGFANHRPI